MRPSVSRIALCYVVFAGLCTTPASAQTEVHRVWQNDAGGTAYDVAAAGQLVFVSNNAGVAIYDLSDPEQPVLASLLEMPSGGAFGLSAAGTTVHIAAISDGMLIVDVADPQRPVVLGSYGNDVADVHVHDDIAYLSLMFGAGTAIVDVTDPTHPVQLAMMHTISGAAAAGDSLWVGRPGLGVVRYDVGNPETPIERGTIPDTREVNNLEYRDGTLYVALYAMGTRVYDVADHSSPRLLLAHPDGGEAWHASGDYPLVCVADLQEGVEILNGSLPEEHRLLVRDASLAPHSLYFDDGYIHVADQNEGYVLLRLDHRPAPRRIFGRRVP